jgi:hypothetical protein
MWGDMGRCMLVPVNTTTCKHIHTHTLLGTINTPPTKLELAYAQALTTCSRTPAGYTMEALMTTQKTTCSFCGLQGMTAACLTNPGTTPQATPQANRVRSHAL